MNPFRPRQISALAVCVLVASIIASCATRRGEGGSSTYSRTPPPASYDARQAGGTSPQHPFEGAIEGYETTSPQLVPTPAGPLLARDLGDGAGGEKLGRRQPGDRDDSDAEVRSADNPFVRVDQRGGDASTFSTDVDTASYTMLRSSLLEQRRLPAPESVRIEEMLNTFHYDYPRPGARDEHPFVISTDTVACPWSPGHRVVRIGVSGREMDRAHRPPANLVFLIDTSGSMAPDNRLPLLLRSMKLLVDQLDARDRVSIVTYAGDAGVALEPTAGDEHRRIRKALDKLQSGGSTYGSGGIQEAYRQARAHFDRDAANRVILATDGDFNVGVTDEAQLDALVREEARAGIFLTVLGFGIGHSDHRLESLADHGNGMYAYIDREQEARRLFVEQLPGSLVTIAQDVKVQVFFNPAAVSSWRLIGYENRLLKREDFNDDRVDAGDIGAGHTVTALYEIVPNGEPATRGVDANPFIASDGGDARPADPAPASYTMRVRLRYQPPGGGDSRLIETDVSNRARADDAAQRDTTWAMAVAAFGMVLRGSPYRGSCDYRLVDELARQGKGSDEARAGFMELVDAARDLERRR